MTTVTSSDRGDAGSTRSQRSARSNSSDIPGQRGGGAAGAQTLRILVLGGGAAADELRRQAADAGAELAQRFSARVTHVVTESGIAADDPRVAKALAADLPVLTVDECAQLMGFCAEPAVGGAGMGTGARTRTEPSSGAEESGVEAKPGAGTDVGPSAAGAGAGMAGGTTARIPAQPVAKSNKRAVGAGVVDAETAVAKAQLVGGAEAGDRGDGDGDVVGGGLAAGGVSMAEAAETSAQTGAQAEPETDGEAQTRAEVESAPQSDSMARAELATELEVETEAVAEAEAAVGAVVEAEAALGSVAEAAWDEAVALETEPAEEVDAAEADRALYVERVELAQYSDSSADLEGVDEAFGSGDGSTEQLVEAAVASSFGGVRAPQGVSLYSPVEGMLGSALDAALLFPPLPISPGESLTFNTDYLIDSYADAPIIAESVPQIGQVAEAAYARRGVGTSGSGGTDVVSGTSSADATSGNSETDTGEAEVEDKAENRSEIGELIELLDLNEIDGASAEVLTAERAAERAQTVASYAWAAVPFASLGLLTPVSMAYAAYRQRSRTLGGIAAWYLFAVTIAFTISATSRGSRTQSAVGDLLTICFAASWIGGTVHSLIIRRQVFGRSE